MVRCSSLSTAVTQLGNTSLPQASIPSNWLSATSQSAAIDNQITHTPRVPRKWVCCSLSQSLVERSNNAKGAWWGGGRGRQLWHVAADAVLANTPQASPPSSPPLVSAARRSSQSPNATPTCELCWLFQLFQLVRLAFARKVQSDARAERGAWQMCRVDGLCCSCGFYELRVQSNCVFMGAP